MERDSFELALICDLFEYASMNKMHLCAYIYLYVCIYKYIYGLAIYSYVYIFMCRKWKYTFISPFEAFE